MKTEQLAVSLSIVAALTGGCTSAASRQSAVPDSATAIRVFFDACIAKDSVHLFIKDTHAVWRGDKWHVWVQGKGCEVFSTDVDPVTATAGPCSYCVT